MKLDLAGLGSGKVNRRWFTETMNEKNQETIKNGSNFC